MELGELIASITDDLTDNYGDETLVNGAGPVGAFWDEAQPSRVQVYIHEDFWGTPAYDVQLPSAVLAAPYNLKNGSSLTWNKMGWRAIVRHIDPPGLQDVNQEIRVIATLTSD